MKKFAIAWVFMFFVTSRFSVAFAQDCCCETCGQTSKPVTAVEVSEEYTVKRKSYDWYTSIPQIRSWTKDTPRASVTVTIALGYAKEDKQVATEISERRIEIVDFLRTYFSNKTFNELSFEQEVILREEIRDYINKQILSNSKIEDVRFTQKDVIQQY